jgi:hypothetical protein
VDQSAATAGLDPAARLTAAVLQRWEQLKILRAVYEPQWTDIGEYMAPGRTETLRKEPGTLRPRRLVDGHGRDAAGRLIAQLHGHMINPATPWVTPKLVRKEADGPLKLFLDGAERRLHDHLMSTSSLFAQAIAEFCGELVWFGNAVIWLGTDPLAGPVFQAVSIWNCWIDQDVNGRVDTVYRCYKITAAEAARTWPGRPALAEKAKKAPNERLEILHAVEPRWQPGETTATKKPWRDVLVWPEGKILLAESGHDRLPYAVGRFSKRAGEIYGFGPCDMALPDVRLSNRISETIMRIAELQGDPPILLPTGFLIGKVDRRPGAVGFYNAQNAMLSGRGDPVNNLLRGGDAQLATAYLQMVHDKIDRAFFIDWMTLPDQIAETATAVNDRRAMRSAGLSHMISRLESEALEPIATHAFEGLAEEGYFDELYDELSDADAEEDIGFTYRSPLHVELMRADVEAVSRFLAYAQQMAPIEPMVLKKIQWPELTDYLAQRFGVPLRLLAPTEKVKAEAEEDSAAAQGAEQMANLQQGAVAAQAGAQAAATLGLVGDPAL